MLGKVRIANRRIVAAGSKGKAVAGSLNKRIVGSVLEFTVVVDKKLASETTVSVAVAEINFNPKTTIVGKVVVLLGNFDGYRVDFVSSSS